MIRSFSRIFASPLDWPRANPAARPSMTGISTSGSKARVRLPQGQPPQLKPGVYLVDPKTMEMTLERRLARGASC